MSDFNIDNQYDPIEETILIALHSRTKSIVKTPALKAGNGQKWHALDFSTFTTKTPMFPQHMYTTLIDEDNTDHYRLFTTGFENLVCDPIKLLGPRSETVILGEDGEIKWTGMVPMKPPRGVVALTNQKVSWFAHHYRQIGRDLVEQYQRVPIPIAGGRMPDVKFLGWPSDGGKWIEEYREKVALHLSLIEDAIRANAVLATVEEHAKLSFAVSDDAYKDFFAMRDGFRNTPTGRRNPILHWCATHLRKSQGKQSSVIGHERGSETISHGNMTLLLSRNRGYGDYI